MDSFLLGIGSWMVAKAIPLAWWTTLICVLFSARIATAFLRDAPRLFTVMALFACAWMLVLGYYSSKVRSEPSGELVNLVTDLASYLLVYVGALLVLETSAKQGRRETHVVALQILALYLVLFIAAPRALDLIAPAPGGLKLLSFSKEDASHFVSAAMVVIGFAVVGLGAWQISSGLPLGILLVTVTIYALLEIYSNTYCVWNECGKAEQLTPGMALVFSALKLLFTFNFGCIVAQYGMSPDMRAAGWWYWIRHFNYLAGAPPRKPDAGSPTTLRDEIGGGTQ